MNRPVLFSVAHSATDSPAAKYVPLTEYQVSLRATLAAIRNLAGEVPLEWLDIGPFKHTEYDDMKVAAVNRCQPRLAIEIHCNGGPEDRSYNEVIHHRDSVTGKEAASVVARVIKDGFNIGYHRHWRGRGARANTLAEDKHLMFFLERTTVPSIIVEGLFLSNLEQARWLNEGGCEAYGLLVADGIRAWLGGARA